MIQQYTMTLILSSQNVFWDQQLNPILGSTRLGWEEGDHSLILSLS